MHAPWRPGSSVCTTLPGFQTRDVYPIRSPLLLADYVISVAKGRNIVEIGTRNGDVSACIANFSHKFVAVEMEKSYCTSLRKRGLTVICKDWNLVDLKNDLPVIDVIMWFVWPPTLSEIWLRRLWEFRVSRRHQRHNMTVIIPYDTHIPEDMRYLPLLAGRYNGKIERLFFDEGGSLSSKTEPSYAHANLWRPGRWGIFHIARFDIGTHSGPVPPALRSSLVESIGKNVRPDWDWQRWGWYAGDPPPNRR